MFKKSILVSLGLCAILSAQDFDTFLQNALHNSPYLQANKLAISQADANSAIVQRYKNPTLELEASRFRPDRESDANGYRAALTQPIRLWGVGDDRASLADATKAEAKEFVTLKRADFIKRLSLLYIEYSINSSLLALAQEEMQVAQTIVDISYARYDAGTIAKIKYLQAKVDLLRSQNILQEQKAKTVASYYKLLAFAGLQEEVEIEKDYNFRLTASNDSQAPSLAYIAAQQKKQEAAATLNTHKIEWMSLYGEVEKERDQKSYRVGIEIPLAIFNTKKEERTIAKLQAKKSAFLLKNQQQQLGIVLKSIKKELALLQGVLDSTQKLYATQKELLVMYEEGYKIANINLIELQNIKNQMIATKEKTITLKKKIQQNIVNYNYAVGAYNESK